MEQSISTLAEGINYTTTFIVSGFVSVVTMTKKWFNIAAATFTTRFNYFQIIMQLLAIVCEASLSALIRFLFPPGEACFGHTVKPNGNNDFIEHNLT